MTNDEFIAAVAARRAELAAAAAKYTSNNWTYENARDVEEKVYRAHRLLAKMRPGSAILARFERGIREANNVTALAPGLAADLGAYLADLQDGVDEATAAPRALAHGELLDLARRLHDDESEPMAAAMVVGAVLENHLRALCQGRAEVQLGQPRRAHSTLNDYAMALRRADVVTAAMMRQFDAWIALRNAAAHHREDQFHPEHVQGMIDGIAALVETHPA
jgi:hypothetical protein